MVYDPTEPLGRQLWRALQLPADNSTGTLNDEEKQILAAKAQGITAADFPGGQLPQASLLDVLTKMYTPAPVHPSEAWTPPQVDGGPSIFEHVLAASPRRLPPTADIFGMPQDNPTANLLPDGVLTQIGAPQTSQSSSGIFDGLTGHIAAALHGLAQPGGTQYNPKPSDLETLLGIGGAVLGGGSPMDMLGSVGTINQYQQLATTRDNSISQINQRNAQILAENSPAGQVRQTQQKFYTSRMANDVNRYIDMIGKDVNHTIPDDERDRIWSQIQSKYSPLGLDPGPSPSQVQQWNSQSASPEFRNAKLVQSIATEHGETAGSIASAMLQSGESPSKVAEYQLKLEAEKTKRAKILVDHKAAENKDIAARIEDYRKRDLETNKGIGSAGGQFSGVKGDVPTTDYLGVQGRINSFHDVQQQSLRSGTLASPSQFFSGNVPANLSKKTYPAYAKSLMGQAAVHGDALAVPLLIATPEAIAHLSAEEKARAIMLDGETAKTFSPPSGKAVLVRINGQIGWAKSKPGI